LGKQVNIELTSWSRFRTRKLTVAPELLGQSHGFTFDGRDTNISLPSADRLAGFYTGEGTGEGKFIDDRLSVSGRRMQDGQPQPLDVHIRDVDVVVSIPGANSVPDEALTRPIKAVELFSEQQQNHLNKLASDYGDIARRAFDLWIRTLRWQVDDWQIGMPAASGAETGWSTYIKEKNTQKDVWAGENILYFRVGKTVTRAVWDETAAALDSGHAPPIFYDLLYDATIHADRKDLQRAVVDAAVAAETYMKTIVEKGFPDGLDEQLKKHINEAPARRVIDKFIDERLAPQQKESFRLLKPGLRKLFEYRNAIVHSGRTEGLTAQKCQKLIKCVRDLLGLAPYKAT
jgi:hypothetical protein